MAALDTVKVSGDVGKAIDATFKAPLTVTGNVAKVVSPGTGDEIKSGMKIMANYAMYDGSTGKMTFSTYKSVTSGDGGGAGPSGFELASLPTEVTDQMIGQKVGERVLAALTQTDSQGTAQTAVVVFDVMSASTIPTRATGDKVTPPAGLPTVTLDKKGAPSISFKDAKKPDKLTVQPLITGKGAKTTTGQTLKVKYTGWVWGNTTAFDSSWTKPAGQDSLSFQIGAGTMIKGWEQGLLGQTVGSQVMLIIPPDLAYGSTQKANIPANSTLVFVVDILDAT